ncbi:unnamed protein product [Musa acuminata subsp. malaccensis]|uniref:(wild Malaysian banana) hypothetical protein n=1 Tax=Musa acuminata subsp. malaccensis TaxID=214687 RepID=A0A8D7AZ28_MUSAM|nr:unnamed protein product [Musa acuminata subsp. malaccensis]
MEAKIKSNWTKEEGGVCQVNAWFCIIRSPYLRILTSCLLQAAASYLKTGSSVILISSIAGYLPQSSMAMYGVTKTALLELTKALISFLLFRSMLNCLAPGFVPTHFADFITKMMPSEKPERRRLCLRGPGLRKTWLLPQPFWHLMIHPTFLEKHLWLPEGCLPGYNPFPDFTL